MNTTTPLDFQELRSISPKAARQAILQILKANSGRVAVTARMLNITLATVYKAIRKKELGELDDSSRSPHVIYNKTADDIQEKVVGLKKKTNYGPLRLKEELFEVYGVELSEHTIRNIVRRNKKKTRGKRQKHHKKGTQQFVDWYSSKAFEVVQIDLKYAVDQKALSMEQIDYIHVKDFPLYQWGAIDVSSRFKLIAYSDEKTWLQWVISWLRIHGFTNQIVFTVDRGEEFGGRPWLKIVELRKLLSGFGCRIIQNHKSSPQENAHLERSHRTHDDEFYIPRILKIQNLLTLSRVSKLGVQFTSFLKRKQSILRCKKCQALIGLSQATPYGRGHDFSFYSQIKVRGRVQLQDRV